MMQVALSALYPWIVLYRGVWDFCSLQHVSSTQRWCNDHIGLSFDIKYLSRIQQRGDIWIRCVPRKGGIRKTTQSGGLSGGLFHAIRNPLTIIQGRLS